MENNTKKPAGKRTVHHILAHSYSVFLFAIFVAIVLDSMFPIRLLPKYLADNVGLFFLIIAPLLIYWAQNTSGKIKHVKEDMTAEHFKRGPYKYTRGPTHLGLALLLIGLGIITNSIFVIGGAIIAYIISKKIFMKEQEELLAKSYGEEYRKYQKEVDPWF